MQEPTASDQGNGSDVGCYPPHLSQHRTLGFDRSGLQLCCDLFVFAQQVVSLFPSGLHRNTSQCGVRMVRNTVMAVYASLFLVGWIDGS